MSRFSVARVNHVVFGILASLLVLVCGVTWQEFRSAAEAREWVSQAHESIDALQDLALGLRKTETAQRLFLSTRDVAARQTYEIALKQAWALTATMGGMRSVVGGSEALAKAVKLLAETWERAILEAVPSLSKDGEDKSRRLGMDAMDEVATVLMDMHRKEEAMLTLRLSVQAEKMAEVRWLVLAGAGMAVLVLFLASRILNGALQQSAKDEADQRAQALRLRTVLDSLAQGVGVFGSDGVIEQSNARLGELVDLHGGKPFPVAQGEALGKEGQRLDMHHTPMTDGGFVLTVTDMTERMRAEKAEREVSKMQSVARLTGGIAHDFNNLLTVILGNLELAVRKLEDSDPLRVRMDRASTAARRGALLTSQLLAFARRQQLSPRPLVLHTAVADFVPMLRQTLGQPYEVDYEATSDVWPAMADPIQLESAVLNLALNARDAMSSGGIILIRLGNVMLGDSYVRKHPDVALGDYAMVSVSDNGCGMAPDVVAQAFEPFFSTKPPGESRGMGLSMVFGFVKQSGGHVEMESTPGMGTTVKIYFPRTVMPQDFSDPIQAGIIEEVEAVVSKIRILMAEDETALREVVMDMLEELGYIVSATESGEEALALFERSPDDFDMLLTDIVMPGIDGRELSKRVSAIRPSIPILYMSGYPKSAITNGGQLGQNVRLLNKPFRGTELAAMVATTLTEARKAG